MLKYSINKLLRNSAPEGDTSYLCRLKISDEKEAKLIKLRDNARAGIKEIWSGIKEKIKEDADLYNRVPQPNLEQLVKLQPKFKMQGSYVYRTIVDPAHKNQDIDLDDGMYIPMSVVMQDDKTMSAAMFEVVDKVLLQMAYSQGWKQVPKSTCSRLQTDEGIHLDIPCYAIPDEDFNRMKFLESKAIYSNYSQDSELDIFNVNLALRDGKWLESNPQHIRDWVVLAKQSHPNFQDVVKIIKGMRDYNYITDGPSSIALMVAIEKIMSASPKLGDLTEELYNVVQKLPSVISAKLMHPHPESSHLTIHDPDDTARSSLNTKFSEFAASLDRALETSVTERETMDILIELFGHRMPNDQDRIIRNKRNNSSSGAARTEVITPIQEHNTFG